MSTETNKVKVESVRLTKWARDSLCRKMIAFRYEVESSPVNQLVKDSAALALAVYNEVFSEKERAAFENLPKGYLPEQTHIQARFGSDVNCLNFNGLFYSNRLSTRKFADKEIYKRMPYNKCSGIVTVFPVDHELTIRNDKLSNRIKQLSEEVCNLQRTIMSTLNSASTTKKLVEIWPESLPFVNAYLGNSSKTHNAIVIPRSELNEKLGLPIEEAA